MENNKNTTIGIIGIAIVILAAGIAIAVTKPNNQPRNNDVNTNQNYSLSSEEKAFDFGTISMAAGKVSHSFRIKNNGDAPVKVAKVYTSCMCTEAFWVKSDVKMGPFGMPGHGIVPKINQTLEPGAEANIEVIFDPAAHGPAGVGPIERVTYLEGEKNMLLEVGIKAIVAP